MVNGYAISGSIIGLGELELIEFLSSFVNIMKDAVQAGKAVYDMSKSGKKLAPNESEIEREYKSLMADQKRVLRKIERIVDAKAKEQGISFNKDQ